MNHADVMISDSSRDYALSHLQYSKTMQTNHNFRILNISVHSPGDSEKIAEGVFIDWRFKLVESKNIGRTLNLCIWAVLCVTSRHVLRWRTLLKNTKLQHTWHLLQIPEGTWSPGRRFIAQGCALRKVTAFSKNTYLNTLLQILPFLKKIPEGARPGQTKQIDREKMTNIRFPASWLKWINSQTTEIIWGFKAWLPNHVRQGSDSMG